MSQLVSKAVDMGRDVAAVGIKAGSTFIERTRDLNSSLGGGARLFDAPDPKVQEVRALLDSKSDRQKLDGMRRLIAMISKGRDVSSFFPDVVKNVVATNLEVRKLVYIFLLRYAEQEPDLALLSINSFQKDLTDSNQLIRALSLRVLSGIRVEVIVPIVLLAIKKCITDMSPYVRKTAAHAVPKLYDLDQSQKAELEGIIETQLNERSTLVIGSVVMAFNEVCPDRLDMVHKHYRKLLRQLIDVDEWGQIAIMTLMLRYARMHFRNPNLGDEDDAPRDPDAPFYSDDEDDGRSDRGRPHFDLDPDHQLLLNSIAPLLNSRNAGVVLSVATLYYYLAPREQIAKVAKSVIRLLSSHREVQYVVLTNIATMAVKRPSMFEPHIKALFVRASDPSFIRDLKLEILTRVASESNIGFLLRELQTYVRSPDKRFVTAAIQAIGRVAIRLPDVTDSCLAGLRTLVQSKNEAVAGEAVVVMRKLLQLRPHEHVDMIRALAKSLDTITVTMARASILWLVGEYATSVERIAPDVLRRFAKSFADEEDIVKLQVLTLGSKLYCHGMERCEELFKYVLAQAKYDMNYDIRDRARFLRALCFDENDAAVTLTGHRKEILLAEKAPPAVDITLYGSDRFALGSMSHLVNHSVEGYEELPDFPEEPPEDAVALRNVADDTAWAAHNAQAAAAAAQSLIADHRSGRRRHRRRERGAEDDLDAFFNDDRDSESDSYYSGSDYSSRSRSRSRSYSRSRSRSYSRSRSRSYSRSRSRSRSRSDYSDYSDDYSDRSYSRSRSRSRSYSGSRSRSRSYSRSRSPSPARAHPAAPTKSSSAPARKAASAAPTISLLDFGDDDSATTAPSVASPPAPRSSDYAALSDLLMVDDDAHISSSSSAGSSLAAPLLTGGTSSFSAFAASTFAASGSSGAAAQFASKTILEAPAGRGLQVDCMFARRRALYEVRMVAVQLRFSNKGREAIERISMTKADSATEAVLFDEIASLAPGDAVEVNASINFNGSTQPIKFNLTTDKATFAVAIEPPVGELMTADPPSADDLAALRTKRGVQPAHEKVSAAWDTSALSQRVLRACNVASVPGKEAGELWFGGHVMAGDAGKLPTLIVLSSPAEGTVKVSVYLEHAMLPALLANAVKAAIRA